MTIVTIEQDDIIGVNFFRSPVFFRGTYNYSLNPRFYTICVDELDKKLKPPKVIGKSSTRAFYTFEDMDDTEADDTEDMA